MAFSHKLAFQIQDFYKEETLQIVEQQPHWLVEDIQGMAWNVDQLAEELGLQDAPDVSEQVWSTAFLATLSETGNNEASKPRTSCAIPLTF